MSTGFAQNAATATEVKASEAKSKLYLRICVIFSIIPWALMFLPWATIKVKGGEKGTYFLFQIKRFFDDVKNFTGYEEFDYSVIMLVLPIFVFLLSIPVSIQFWYLVKTKKSLKNMFLSYRTYCIFEGLIGGTYLLYYAITCYVARFVKFIKDGEGLVAYGYNPVGVTIVPFLFIIMAIVGYQFFMKSYYDEKLFQQGEEYFIMPKMRDAVQYMQRTTFFLTWEVALFIISVIPMFIRAVKVVVDQIAGKADARLMMFGGEVTEKGFERYINPDFMNKVMWILPTVFTLITIRAAIIFIVNVFTKKNHMHICTAFRNCMMGVMFSTLTMVLTSWIINIICIFNPVRGAAQVLAGRVTADDAVASNLIKEAAKASLETDVLSKADKFALGMADMKEAFSVPAFAYIFLAVSIFGILYINRNYCYELCFKNKKASMPVPRKYVADKY